MKRLVFKTASISKKVQEVLSMKKILLTVAMMFLLVTGAEAATKVHSGFSTDSSGCAACHITHAANAKKLLLTGNNQTEFCYACHGTAKPGSPYDVRNGVVLDGTTKFDYNANPIASWTGVGSVRPSFSGGFAMTFDFQAHGDVAIDPAHVGITAVADPVNGKFLASSSAHSVEAITVGGQSAWDTTNKIPGGTVAVVGSLFTCSSCHDPHGYDSADPDGAGALDANPRLLRHKLPKYTATPTSGHVNLTVDISGVNGDDGTLRVTGYPDATINRWCAGCHDLLDVGKNAGVDKGTDTRFRHAMGLALPTTAGVNLSMANGTPVATGNKLVCTSCHRAHGTGATMTTVANNWTGQDYQNLANPNVAKSGSALLRLKNRDVCYNCHKEATQNINSTPTGLRQAPTY